MPPSDTPPRGRQEPSVSGIQAPSLVDGGSGRAAPTEPSPSRRKAAIDKDLGFRQCGRHLVIFVREGRIRSLLPVAGISDGRHPKARLLFAQLNLEALIA